MKLQDLVSTLKQSTRLLELGFTDSSTFYWNVKKSASHGEEIYYGNTSKAICSAYLPGELWSLIPSDYVIKREWGTFSIHRPDGERLGVFEHEAHAVAQLAIYCLSYKVPTV